MANVLSEEIIAAVAKLGELIKAEESHVALKNAIDGYEHSEELNALIAEYNTQQDILADNFAKENSAGDEFTNAVQDRIDVLYDKIVSHPVYTEYVGAKQGFDALMNSIWEEIQFAVTGQRPCTHDCSSCHSHCDHDHE